MLLLCCHVKYCEWSVDECASMVPNIFRHPIEIILKFSLGKF